MTDVEIEADIFRHSLYGLLEYMDIGNLLLIVERHSHLVGTGEWVEPPQGSNGTDGCYEVGTQSLGHLEQTVYLGIDDVFAIVGVIGDKLDASVAKSLASRCKVLHGNAKTPLAQRRTREVA